MDSLAQDVRYALRGLRRTPGFTAAAVLALALGIGASAAVFSVLDAVVLRPLPFPQPERLVRLFETVGRGQDFPFAPANYLFLADQQTAFDRVAAWSRRSANFSSAGGALPVNAPEVSANLFATFGARVQLGRDFAEGEDRSSAPRTAILSDAFWRRQFGGDPRVLGTTVSIDGAPHTVIGVAARGLSLPGAGEVDVYRALAFDAKERANHGSHLLRVVGRMKAGVTLERAQADVGRVASLLEELAPDYQKGIGQRATDLRESISGAVRPALLMLLAAVLLVLFIACGNVAGMLLARGAARQRELSIRAALGSTRARLVRQLLTESVLLAVVGGALGVAMAAWGIDVLVALAPEGLERLGEVALDGRVLAFALGVSAVSGVIAGVAPALQAARIEVHRGLYESGHSATSGRAHRRLRAALVVGEIALALVLVLGAGLLLRSFQRVLDARLGFEPRGLLTARLSLSGARYSTAAAQRRVVAQVMERATRAPGVAIAAITSHLPMEGTNWKAGIQLEGEPPPPPGEDHSAPPNLCTPSYFQAMHIPLLRGRLLQESDVDGAPLVAVVDEAFVKRFFHGRDPLGHRVTLTEAAEPVWRTIVGVVGDVRADGLDQDPPAQIYAPFAQRPWFLPTLIARSASGKPMDLVPTLAREVRAIDPELPLSRVRTLDEVLSGSVASRRFQVLLVGVFAAVALILAALGIYGVMAHSVAQRTRELGIRMALGAPRGAVLRMVVLQGLRLAALGVGIGLAASLAGARALQQLLYEVSPTDPVTYAAVAALLGGVTLLASWLPARRATRVDPAIALRAE